MSSFLRKFCQIVWDVGSFVLEETRKQKYEIQEIKQKYESRTDKELLRVVHSDSGLFGNSGRERKIAFDILKERGFSIADIRSKKT